MKNVPCITFGLLLGAFSMADYVAAGERLSCLERQREITFQIEQARTSGNDYRLNGLQQALSNVEQYCSDRSTADRQQESLSRAQADVHRQQQHLKAARQYGDPNLVKKYERKLQRAQEKLQKLSAANKGFQLIEKDIATQDFDQ